VKVSFDKDEMIVDLTQPHFKKKIMGDNEIVLTKNNYLVPILKGVPKSFSYYNRNKVNPHYLNCTCKEYRDSIKLYPIRDIRRICKHIFFIITKDFNSKIDALTTLLLAHRFWDKVNDVFEIKYQNQNIFVSVEKDLKFFRIYRKNSDWKFYTFFPSKNSWLDNLPPFNSSSQNEILIQFIQDILAKQTTIKNVI
jgi:hypothetical protein